MSNPASRRFGAGESVLPLGVLFAIVAVDEAAKDAFGLLTPEVRDAFHLTDAGISLILAIGNAAALACTVPVALLADRFNRVRIALIGAALGAAFALGLGLAPTSWLVAVTLAGLLMGQAVIFPTHNSLLSDYYPLSARSRVYSAHRGGMALGAITGVLLGAGLAAAFSWRAPFIAFAIPVVIVIAVGLRLREPARGRYDQIVLAGPSASSEPGVALAQPSPSPRCPSRTLLLPPARRGGWFGRSGCCVASSSGSHCWPRLSSASPCWPLCSTRGRSTSALRRARSSWPRLRPSTWSA